MSSVCTCSYATYTSQYLLLSFIIITFSHSEKKKIKFAFIADIHKLTQATSKNLIYEISVPS